MSIIRVISLSRMRLIAGSVLCSLVVACASTAPQAPVARLGLQLPPADLQETLSVQQHLIVERANRIDELDTALEIDPEALNLVGMKLGQRVLSLHYDGKKLTTWRHFMLPEQVRGEDVLEDIQLTLWPANSIRAALPTTWALREEPNKVAGLPLPRRILLRDGTPIMHIDYPGKTRWEGAVVLTNLRYHYRLTIESVTAP